MKHRKEPICPTPQEMAGLASNAPVLLALSGGADSRALLHMLAHLSQQHGFALSAAHLHHGIRGEEADRDLQFCRALAKRYNIPFYERRADIPALAAQSGRSEEQEAREVRYAFLEEVMHTHDIPLLATAHHADDQLETVLFRLCRGTGSDGLCGIAPMRALGDGRFLVRPLLSLTRREILQYCTENNLEYVVDSTNADTAYARNRIRAEIVPVMESLFAEPQKRVTALTDDLREDAEYLSAVAADFLKRPRQGSGLPISELRQLPPSILRRVLLMWVARECGSGCERVHLEALRALVLGKTPNARVALPNRCCAERHHGCLTLTEGTPRRQNGFCLPFCVGACETPTGEWQISVKNEEKAYYAIKVNNLYTQTCINLQPKFDIMNDSLCWRPMQEGDRLLLRGMHRRLRRLYCESGLGARERREIPLLCDGEGVLWAPFVGLRDEIAVLPDFREEQKRNGEHQ